MHYRRQALVMPPTMTSDGAHKFAMFMLEAVLDGRASRGSGRDRSAHAAYPTWPVGL
jgi:hypothetical protein